MILLPTGDERVRDGVDAGLGRYDRAFGIGEIRDSRVLQWMHWALLFGFYLSFSEWVFAPWVSRHLAEAGEHLCLPYLQDCGRLYFLTSRPFGYSQGAFYAVLFGLLGLSGAAAVTGRWRVAHAALIPLFLWKAVMVMALTYQAHADFEYFHLPFAFLYLFARNKLYFLRRAFAAVYFLSASVKFHGAWVVGTYFSTLELGMPLVPDAAIPYVSNAVILFEIAGSWLLLGGDRRIRLGAVAAWTAFHLYSVLLVGYRYPSHCVPLLWTLFLPDITRAAPPLGRRSWAGWLCLFWLFAVHAAARSTSVDVKETLELRKLGVSMFDSNHQCVSIEEWRLADGSSRTRRSQSRGAMKRCGPYESWFHIRQRCSREEGRPARVEWRFLKSTNGGPFYELVHESDACRLDYSAFSHNEWIRSSKDGARIAGYPRKNHTAGPEPYPARPIVFPDPAPMRHPAQAPFERHERLLIFLWQGLWLLTLAVAAVLEARRAGSRPARPG